MQMENTEQKTNLEVGEQMGSVRMDPTVWGREVDSTGSV